MSRTTRLLLVLLLAALLPARAVLAATMWCGPMTVAPAAAEPAMDHSDCAGLMVADEGAPVDDAPADAGKCKLCAAFCSVPTVPGSEPPAVVATTAVAAAVPPADASVAPYLSSGPERPPRST